MSNIHLDRLDLRTQQDVITLCDYATCPTIKSNNTSNWIIVVKSDGNLHPIEAGRNHGDCDHYKSLEDRTVGGAYH